MSGRLITAVALLLLHGVAVAQEAPTVKLSLMVTDKKQNPINQLKPSDLQLKQDKKDLELLALDIDQRPVDLAIMLDLSNSFQRFLPASVQIAKLIIANRRPADRISLAYFISSDNIGKLEDFTSDESLLFESLKKVKPEGGQSALIDALYLGVQAVAEFNKGNPARRRVLIVLTDGEDRNSYYRSDALIDLIREEGVQVFSLAVTKDLDKDGGFIRKSVVEKAETLLTSVAEESGGRAFFAKTPEDLLNATADTVNHLKAQFVIEVRPLKTKPGFHKLDVKVLKQNGEERIAFAPRGYLVRSAATKK